MNGKLADMEKVMRGLKLTNTAVLTGYQLYDNYFMPYEALNGKTPAEKCGIIIEEQEDRKCKAHYLTEITNPDNKI